MTVMFSPVTGAAPSFTVAPRLEQIVGYVPANLNMIDTSSGNQLEGAFGNTNTPNQYVAFDATDNQNGVTKWNRTENMTFTSGRPAPDGTSHAQTIVPTTTNGNHDVFSDKIYGTFYQNPTGGLVWRMAAIAKPNGYTRIVIRNDAQNISNTSSGSGFDLAGGNANYDNNADSNITIVQSVIQPISGATGWMLCYYDWYINNNYAYSSTQGIWNPRLFVDNGSGTSARSLSFAGDGTSGVDIFWFNVLPATMWKMTNRAFFDDFNDITKSIDLLNSQAPGFNWYINSNWTDSAYNTPTNSSNFWGTGSSSPISPPNPNLSQPEASTVQLLASNAATGPGTPSTAIVSPCGYLSGAHIDPTRGLAFRGAQVKEILRKDFSLTYANRYFTGTALQNTSYNTRGAGVEFWGVSEESLDSAVTAPIHINPLSLYGYTEWNVTTDAAFNNPSGANFAWKISSGSSANGGGFGGGSVAASGFTFRQNTYHRFTGVWIPAHAEGKGYGWYFWFLNGIALISRNGGDRNGYNLGAGLHSESFADGARHSDGHAVNLIYLAENGGSIGDWVSIWQLGTPITCYTFWNLRDSGADIVVDNQTNPGLKLTKPSAGGGTWESIRADMGKTSASAGKWYWEHTLSGASIGASLGVVLGLVDSTADILTHLPGGSGNGFGLQYNTAASTNIHGSVVGNTGNAITWTAGDVIGIAFDSVAGKAWAHKNGNYLASMSPGTSTGIWSGMTSGTWYPAVGMNAAGNSNAVTTNFGQTAFAFSLPTGYSGWTEATP